MKRQFLLMRMLLLFALIVGSGTMWATDITYTFTSSTWNATAGGNSADWINTTNGDSFESSNLARGIAKSKATINGTSPIVLTNISSITVTASANMAGPTLTIYKIVDDTETSIYSASMTKDNNKEYTVNLTGANIFSGKVKVVLASSSSYKSVWIKSVKVTYSAGGGEDPVPATGVSLKDATTLTVGDTEQLTAAVTPNNATDQDVSWESNNPSVATVDAEGNVSAVGIGTAQITVTTHDGGYTANCNVTVVPVAATIDLSTNGWGISENPDKTVDETEFSDGTYTIKLKGSTGNGYYFDTDNVMLGKKGATLTLPAFPFKVSKIKVYGTSGASASVTFNIFVGDDAVSTSATSSKVDHEFEIDAEKQDAGTVYVIKVTNDNNMRISKIKIFGYTSVTLDAACTDGKGKYYGTYSNSYAFRVPADLEVSEISVISGELLVDNYSTGDIVPANTGVMIASTSPGAHTINIATGGTSVLDNNNMLKPSGDSGINADAMAAAAPSCKYYRLTMHNGTQIGYYWGAATGAAFTLGANKAYLAVPANAARSGFNLFGDDDTTGIEAVDVNTESANVAREYYNLNGQRVANPSKGLYIVNGKKVIIK